MNPFYDTHAHLDYPELAPELPHIIARAHAAGVAKIIAIGTDLESSARALAITERYPEVYAAVGWHPTHVMTAPDDIRPALRQLARHPKVVAIGETGMDYYRLPSQTPGGTAADDAAYRAKQAIIFRQQLEVAAEMGLNCVIHQRSALDDTLAAVAEFKGRTRGVFHCFVEDPSALERVLALDCLVSFTGIITFKTAATIRASAAAVPADCFMVETDSPYLAPVPYRGKPGEPSYVVHTAAEIARVRQCSLAELSCATCATAERFFPKLRG